MINLEFYREKIKDFLDENLKYINLLNERFGYKVDYGENYTDKFVDWLLEEHKEPMRGTILQYGNYGDEWYEIGNTCGYA